MKTRLIHVIGVCFLVLASFLPAYRSPPANPAASGQPAVTEALILAVLIVFTLVRRMVD